MTKQSTKKQAASEPSGDIEKRAQPSGLLAALNTACRESLQTGRAADHAAQESLLGALHAVKLQAAQTISYLDGDTAAAVHELVALL